jgi:gamma-resorcylate decarboxylase
MASSYAASHFDRDGLEIGSDRVLFSVDSPYETVQEQSDWFDSLPNGETDRRKIGRLNALLLLRLSSPDA